MNLYFPISGLLSVEPEIIVSGCVGSTAVLSCALQHKGPERPHIRWLTDSEIVFERWGKEAYQGEKSGRRSCVKGNVP